MADLSNFRANKFHIPSVHRYGFALDYSVSSSSNDLLNLVISGSEEPLKIYHPTLSTDENAEESQQILAVARTGDDDGVNLPWFDFADSILLYWWIHQDDVEAELVARWKWASIPDKIQKLDVVPAGQERNPLVDPLLSIQVQQKGTIAELVEAVVPDIPISSSPTVTYPFRVAIVCLLTRPTLTIVVIMDFLWEVREKLGSAYSIPANLFLTIAGLCSLLRCLNGPSFELVMENAQDRLERYKRRYEGNRSPLSMYAAIGQLQKLIEAIAQSHAVMWMVGICREGWHPERDRERAEASKRRDDDIEKAASGGVRIRIRT